MTDSTFRLPVTRNGEIVAYATVDEDVYEWARHLPWNLQSNGYARCNRTYLHRIASGIDPDDKRWVDHINRDRLDNRRSNLRIIEQAVSGHNVQRSGGTSRHRGVWRCKQTGRWGAQVEANGTKKWVGRFDTEDEAALAAHMERLRLMSHADPKQLDLGP